MFAAMMLGCSIILHPRIQVSLQGLKSDLIPFASIIFKQIENIPNVVPEHIACVPWKLVLNNFEYVYIAPQILCSYQIFQNNMSQPNIIYINKSHLLYVIIIFPVPSRINHISSGGHLQVKKGSSVRIECTASGNPTPNITWSRKNNVLPNGKCTDKYKQPSSSISLPESFHKY